MSIRGLIDTTSPHQPAGISPATRLAGVPLVLWAAHQLTSTGIPPSEIAIVTRDDALRAALDRHQLNFLADPPPDAQRLVRADWQQPFRNPSTPAPAAIDAIHITDNPSLELAQAVARGLPPDDPRVAAIRRYALPTDTDFRAVITDVDGCLTDGIVTRTESGDAMRAFNTKDGIGHRKLQAADIQIGWLSTAMECTSILDRARSLGVDAVDAGTGHKGPRFENLCAKLGVAPEQVVFLGDDIHDLPAMRLAGAMACPADAHPDVRRECDLILSTPGGRGAFRELADLLTDHISEHQLKL